MQQFWAEVKTLYEAGESWFLDEAELASLNESNEQFMTLDPISERLETRMDWDAPTIDWQWRTATEVALLIGLPNPSRSDVTRVATYLHKNRGCTAKRSNGLSMTLVPPPVFA
jgi:predicted P-loop ATPase